MTSATTRPMREGHLVLQPRVGLLVPPRNPTAEAEVGHLLRDRASLVVRGLPSRPAAPLALRLRAYLDGVGECLDDLVACGVRAILVACTGSFYASGLDEARVHERRWTAAAGVPVITPVTAIAREFEQRGLSRPLLVSPYPRDLTAEAHRFWSLAGWQPVQTVRLGEGNPYDVPSTALVDAVRSADLSSVDSVLVSGTGMPALADMWALRQEVDVPLLSSNCALATQAVEVLAHPDASNSEE